MTNIFDEHTNITLTTHFIDFCDKSGSWKRKSLDNEWKAVLESLLADNQPGKKTRSVPFSWENPINNIKYRCHLTHTQRGWQIALRPIIKEIPTFSDLMLPSNEIMSLISESGMTLFVGPQSSGKSTTLVSTVASLSPRDRGRCVVLEDPCEFEYPGPQIDQREISIDVDTFADGIKDAYRGGYKTIIVQEIRDPETAREAANLAASGHTILATMHANSPYEAVIRFTGLVGSDMAKNALGGLSGIFCQRLIMTGQEQLPAFPIYESLQIDRHTRLILMEDIARWVQLKAQTKRQNRSTFASSAEKAVRNRWCTKEMVSRFLTDV